MRVLFTCVVGHGHFNPMVPLAQAFEAAGHRVAFATDPGFSEHVRRMGFEAFAAGLDMVEARRRFAETRPGWAEVPAWERLPEIHAGLFAGVRVEPMLADLGPLIETWRPDLLIHDSAEMSGAIAAEQAGIAHAEHSFGVIRPAAVRRRSTAALAAVAERLGVVNPGVGGLGGELYLDVCPPGLQDPDIADVPHVQRMRPMGFDGDPEAVLPLWLTAPRDRPLVYVTMGTEFNREPAVFRAILDGLAREPVDVLVTVGSTGDPGALAPIASNTRVERFVPQSAVLARAAAFVSHGGSGAMLGAVRAGVPMLAIPQGADQFLNAERVVATGIGLRLLPFELSAPAVRGAVGALLEDRRYAETIGSHRASLEALPPPDAVVPVLEALAAAREAHDGAMDQHA